MPKKISNRMLYELMEEWLEKLKPDIKLSTYSTYSFYTHCYLEPYAVSISARKLNQVKVKELLCMIQDQGRIHRKDELSASSMRLIYFILKSAIHYGEEIGEIASFPFPNLKISRSQEKRFIVLHHKEQERLEEYILHNFTSMSAGILLSLYTGLRIGEVCALTWEQINLEEGFLTVSQTIQRIYLKEQEELHSTKVIITEPKTQNARRDIPLSNHLIQLLNPLKPTLKTGIYFLTGSKNYCEPRRYRNFFKKILEEIGIAPVSFHACRHTFASRCIEIGVDAKTVSKLLGHSNVNLTLNRYVHSNLELQRKEMERLGNLLSIE